MFQLHSSPNTISGLTLTSRSDGNDDNRDTNGNERADRHKERQSRKKIQFVNFWGTKLASNDESVAADMPDPRHVPFVPTLDAHDGPLPVGAHIMEGKSEFDSKSTCRISIDVKTSNVEKLDDVDAVVRRLQACVDAGFDTFQLHDQTSNSLGIIRRMNENTPSSINKHWSVGLQIHSVSPDSNHLSTKSDLRQTVLDLIEQTGSDALDSLKVACGNLHRSKSMPSDDSALEMFEHLIDLQREGWIRSIGVRGMESPKFQRDITTYFGDYIDFEEREGSLLLPPPSIDLCSSKNYMRIADVLGGGLLTDIYSNDRTRRKVTDHSSLRPQPMLTKDNILLLKEWALRRERQNGPSSTSLPIWKQYQEDVLDQLNWIAMKHGVTISAVSMRWALQCGSTAVDTNLKAPIVSSALADIVVDDPNDDMVQKLAELRQVFRFQLDEEDRQILFDLSSSGIDESQSNEQDNLDIDFNNPALWL
jgi:aryl-alcohol dehydrogenase-like predicted oxidoreductase